MFQGEVQKAIYDLLIADIELMSLIVGVYDNVPQSALSGDDAAFPFITISDQTTTSWNTTDTLGGEISYNISTWSRQAAKLETWAIQKEIVRILNRVDLIVPDANVVVIYNTSNTVILDPDGVTNHGVTGFNIIIDYSPVIPPVINGEFTNEFTNEFT